MHLSSLQRMYTDGGDGCVSAYMDVSRTDPQGGHEVDVRWRDLRRSAEATPDTVDPAVLDLVGERVTRPTGHGGSTGRAVVAAGADVVLDQLLAQPPARDELVAARIPHLMPLLRARADQTPYLLVDVDHAGADVVDVVGTPDVQEARTVDGEHDVLHKVPGGGWSHRRWQSRVEDSWERNAAQVARDLEKIVVERGPEVVFLAGEPSARTLVHRHAGGRLAPLLQDLESGGRAAGVKEEVTHEEVAMKLAHHRTNRVAEVLDDFAARQGADKAVADGFQRVVEALRAGAVEALLLKDQPESTLTLWGGPDPLQVGRTAEEITAMGSEDAFEDRADELIVRALAFQDAELVLVDQPHAALRDGIGALLRFDSRPERPGAG